VFAPAHSPPTGTVKVTLKDRGAGPLHTITFPNFPGTTDVVTVQLDDFTQPATTTSTKTSARRRAKHHRRAARRVRRRRARTRPSFTG
jgi:hypothetical protein